MEHRETLQFKRLFNKFCRGEANAGRCNDMVCTACPVGLAWERIFGVEDPDAELEG